MSEGKIQAFFKWVYPFQSKNLSPAPQIQALHGGRTGHRPLFAVTYDGEKNVGEMGPILDYQMDYGALRVRSRQMYIESEVAQIVIDRYSIWVIGGGLKLEPEPSTEALETEGISIDAGLFKSTVKARFRIFSKSINADHSKRRNLNIIASECFKDSKIGGDTLVVLRFDGNVTVELFDGAHIVSPSVSMGSFFNTLENGNRIINGVEINKKGEVIAYHIRKKNQLFGSERIRARTDEGLLVAFMVFGSKYRIDSVRGIPKIASTMEAIKKMERYKEATLGSAEEQAKIAYQITHESFSTGESPFLDQMTQIRDVDNANVAVDDVGKELARNVAATTNKEAYNMPRGSKIESLMHSNQELQFKDFYLANFGMVAAAAGMPPEVALSKYDSNFSSSRAALKDWEHSMEVERSRFQFEFYQPIYNFWLHTEILKNKVQAPGYLMAFMEDNNIILDSYRNSRFIGASVPHIDPLKEAKAEREKLGLAGKDLPLTTQEAATEALNGGDSLRNTEQFAKELETSKDLDITSEVEPVAPIDVVVQD